MSISETFSLFGYQFLSGLLLAGFIPICGMLLYLRREWLAALGYVHIAAGFGMLAAVTGIASLLGAFGGAVLAATAKARFTKLENSIYGLMILGGWAMMILIASNDYQSHLLAEALIDGQLYYTTVFYLVCIIGLLLLGSAALYWLMPKILLEYLLPSSQACNNKPLRVYTLIFDILITATVALAALTIGIMATFAFILIPAWIAFGIGKNWRQSLWLASCISIFCYCCAFTLAIYWDQPFAPMLVLLLLLACPLRFLRWQQVSPPADGDALS